ncbi:MAG: helix-turn-helix transcriptional regulator [Clostridia bacterium]|nr:helix-turn-helix transcriptional regulator [Clostridia bacterium]
MTVGERVRAFRKKEGYSQNELAGIAGISQSHLRRVELGESRMTVDHLQMVCDALGISLKEFFDDGSDKDELAMEIAKLTPKQKQKLLEFLKTM